MPPAPRPLPIDPGSPAARQAYRAIAVALTEAANQFAALGAEPPPEPPVQPQPDDPGTGTNDTTGPNAPLPAAVLSAPLFAAEPWNLRVDGLPAHPDSAAIIARYGDRGLNPVFGFDWDGHAQGIPYNVVDGSRALMPVVCKPPWSDKTYTINAPISSAWSLALQSPPDNHLIIVCIERRKLWEFWGFAPSADRISWVASSGIEWDLSRPHAAQHAEGATSADAAGLPMLPGVLTFDRLMDGTQRTLRISVPNNGNTPGWYKLPAHTTANANDTKANPVSFGARVRLSASFDRSPFKPGSQARAILDVLARWGAIVADGTDSGQGWTLDGAWDDRWTYAGDLDRLGSVPATALEVVDDGLYGPAWRVELGLPPTDPTPTETPRPAAYRVGYPVTITATLIQPPPGTGTIALAPRFRSPGGVASSAEPWVLDFPAGKAGFALTARFTPDAPGKWAVEFQSWAGGNLGRRAPEALTLEVVV